MSNDIDPIDYMQAQVTEPLIRVRPSKPIGPPQTLIDSGELAALRKRAVEIEAALAEMIRNCFRCDGTGDIGDRSPKVCPVCLWSRQLLGLAK